MTTLRCSVALPPSPRFVAHAVIAEQLGYERLWAFDSPALYTDIWIALARAADATTTLGLGTGVAVPSLRHPMVTASAIAAVEEIAPVASSSRTERDSLARKTLGQKPMRWSDLERYAREVRALLDGETIDIDGRARAPCCIPMDSLRPGRSRRRCGSRRAGPRDLRSHMRSAVTAFSSRPCLPNTSGTGPRGDDGDRHRDSAR